MEKKVVLDDKSFKALSAESRVNILKKLTERRMTLSELSKRLALRDSTVKEHCNLLLEADLVTKIDEGRKWKYYELTHKGKQILSPAIEQAKVFVMLSISAILFTSIILIALQGTILGAGNSLTNLNSEKAFDASQESEILVGITSTTPSEDSTIRIDQSITLTGVDYNLFSISIIVALVIGLLGGWFVGRKN